MGGSGSNCTKPKVDSNEMILKYKKENHIVLSTKVPIK